MKSSGSPGKKVQVGAISQTLNFNVPPENDLAFEPEFPFFTTYARARLSRSGEENSFGESPDGEVEDYEVTLLKDPPPIPEFSIIGIVLSSLAVLGTFLYFRRGK